MWQKNVTFTHGSKRGGIATCIVMYLIIVFVNTYTYLKQCMNCFKLLNELFYSCIRLSWIKNVSNILFTSVTVRHKNVQSNVPVGHILISLYCWHSNVNKSFEIKIGSEQSANFLKTIHFKRRPSTGAAFMEAFWCGFHENHTYTFLTYEYRFPDKISPTKIPPKKNNNKKGFFSFVSL